MRTERRPAGLGDWEVEQALQMRPNCLAEVERLADWNALDWR